MDGFLLINKPKGVTSFDVVQYIRKISSEKHVGHGGTLDPMATGLLLLAVGKMTRMLEYAKLLGKTYEATIELGKTSDTFDTEGTMQAQQVTKKPTRKQIETALVSFTGDIEQTPPPFSAVHIGGIRAYKLARKKVLFSLPSRTVRIHQLHLLSYAYPFVTLSIECSAGTYVRSLAHDLGEQFHTGGILVGLQRTMIGPLPLDMASPLDHISVQTIASHFLSLSSIQNLFSMDPYPVKESVLEKLRNGQPIPVTRLTPTALVLCIYEGKLIGVGKVDAAGTTLHPEKVFL